jgi:hypothetical protein
MADSDGRTIMMKEKGIRADRDIPQAGCLDQVQGWTPGAGDSDIRVRRFAGTCGPGPGIRVRTVPPSRKIFTVTVTALAST